MSFWVVLTFPFYALPELLGIFLLRCIILKVVNVYITKNVLFSSATNPERRKFATYKPPSGPVSTGAVKVS